MKTVKIFLLAYLCILTYANSQNPTTTVSQKSLLTVNGLEKFKNTDFMVKFNVFKSQIEQEARDFIARQNSYNRKDISRVQTAYEKTAGRFNLLLIDIKEDFLSKEKLKVINKYPEVYSEGLSRKIADLEKFYKDNMVATIAAVTQTDGYGIFDPVVDLIRSAADLTGFFRNNRLEKQAMADDYVQKNLVDPYKFTSWTDLVSTTPQKYDNFNNGNNNNNNGGNNNGGNNNGSYNNGSYNNNNGNNNSNNGNYNNGGSNNNSNTGSYNNNNSNKNNDANLPPVSYNNGGINNAPSNGIDVGKKDLNDVNQKPNSAYGVEGPSILSDKTATDAKAANKNGAKTGKTTPPIKNQ